MSGKITEAMIETQMLEYLNILGHYAFKVKDQTEFRNGAYRKSKQFMVNGVADIICVLKTSETLFLEVKTPKGIQSPAQKNFQARIEDMGAFYRVVRSVSEVKDILKLFEREKKNAVGHSTL